MYCAWCLSGDRYQQHTKHNTTDLCSVYTIILITFITLEEKGKLVIVEYGKFFDWKKLHNKYKYPLLSNVFSHPSYMPWRYIMALYANSCQVKPYESILGRYSLLTLLRHRNEIRLKRQNWGLTTCEKLCKKITCHQKTTEHHERNVTCVLEPNYNLAHAPLNLTVIWLIC